MGGVDRVIKKMTSTVDGNETVVKSNENLTDRKAVEEAMLKGISVYNHSQEWVKPCDWREIKLPYIEEFVKKYPHFLRSNQKEI